MSNYKIDKARTVKKGWGVHFDYATMEDQDRIGEIWGYHDKQEPAKSRLRKVETVKVLYFDRDKKLSLHFHKNKEEIFICALGRIKVETITPEGLKEETVMHVGDRIIIPSCTPHRMAGVDDMNILVEVSTHHEDSDSYRIEKGD